MIENGEEQSHRGVKPPVHTPDNEPRPFSKEKLRPLESFLSPLHKDKLPLTLPSSYRYREVWLRAFAKLRAQGSVNRLGKDLQLYGASIIREDHCAEITRSDAQKLITRAYTMVGVSKSSPTVFSPGSFYRFLWSFIYFLLMIYTAFIMPYRMAFFDDGQVDGWFILDSVVNALFFVDILLTLNTAYYDNEGTLIVSRKAIFLNYLKGWLLIDLVACFPFSAVGPDTSDSSNNSNQMSGMLRLMRLPRLYRLIRLARIFSVMRKETHSRVFEQLQELVSLKHGSIRIIVFALSFILALHLMSCLWYFVPTMEGMTPDTWVVMRNLQDSSVSERYVNSLYWAMTTLATVGYGDIVPTTVAEKIVAIFWMLFGVCFFSFVVSSLVNVLNIVDSKRTVLAGKLAAMDEFSAEASLAKDLRFRLRHALRYSSIHTGFSSQVKRNIFNELPRALRFEVAMAMHRGAAKLIPFFSDKDQAFIAAVVPFLNSLQVPELEAVFNEGEYADEIYFISKGFCSVMCGDYPMKKMQKGSYFGEIEVLFMIPRKFTVVASVRVDLLSMNKKLLNSIQDDFPPVYEEMREIARIRDKLNDKAKLRFLALFADARKSYKRKRTTKARREINTLAEDRLAKRNTESSEQRLTAIEDTVKDIQRIVTTLLNTQKGMQPGARTEDMAKGGAVSEQEEPEIPGQVTGLE